MSKNHDFRCDAPVPDGPHVIQFRSFIPATLSNFEVHVSHHPAQDNEVSFRRFMAAQLEMYLRFGDKWIKSAHPGRIIMHYESIVAAPASTIRPLLSVYGYAEDDRRVDHAINKVKHITWQSGKASIHREGGIAERRDVQAFRYFNADLFLSFSERASAAIPREEPAST